MRLYWVGFIESCRAQATVCHDTHSLVYLFDTDRLPFSRHSEIHLDIYGVSVKRVEYQLHLLKTGSRVLTRNAVEQFLLSSKILVELVVLVIIAIHPDLHLGRVFSSR